MYDPMTSQVGGSHYSKLKIQPFEFSMANGWDSAAHTILKYVHRHGDKNGAQDLRKAAHVCDIRFTLLQRYQPQLYSGRVLHGGSFQLSRRILMRDYIIENEVSEDEAHVLQALEIWVSTISVSEPIFNHNYRVTRELTTNLLEYRYGEKA